MSLLDITYNLHIRSRLVTARDQSSNSIIMRNMFDGIDDDDMNNALNAFESTQSNALDQADTQMTKDESKAATSSSNASDQADTQMTNDESKAATSSSNASDQLDTPKPNSEPFAFREFGSIIQAQENETVETFARNQLKRHLDEVSSMIGAGSHSFDSNQPARSTTHSPIGYMNHVPQIVHLIVPSTIDNGKKRECEAVPGWRIPIDPNGYCWPLSILVSLHPMLMCQDTAEQWVNEGSSSLPRLNVPIKGNSKHFATSVQKSIGATIQAIHNKGEADPSFKRLLKCLQCDTKGEAQAVEQILKAINRSNVTDDMSRAASLAMNITVIESRFVASSTSAQDTGTLYRPDFQRQNGLLIPFIVSNPDVGSDRIPNLFDSKRIKDLATIILYRRYDGTEKVKDSQLGHCDAFIPAPNYLTSLFNSPSLKLEPTALTPLIYTDSIRCFLAPYFQTRTYDSDKDEQPSSFQHIRTGSIVYTESRRYLVVVCYLRPSSATFESTFEECKDTDKGPTFKQLKDRIKSTNQLDWVRGCLIVIPLDVNLGQHPTFDDIQKLLDNCHEVEAIKHDDVTRVDNSIVSNIIKNICHPVSDHSNTPTIFRAESIATSKSYNFNSSILSAAANAMLHHCYNESVEYRQLAIEHGKRWFNVVNRNASRPYDAEAIELQFELCADDFVHRVLKVHQDMIYSRGFDYSRKVHDRPTLDSNTAVSINPNTNKSIVLKRDESPLMESEDQDEDTSADSSKTWNHDNEFTKLLEEVTAGRRRSIELLHYARRFYQANTPDADNSLEYSFNDYKTTIGHFKQDDSPFHKMSENAANNNIGTVCNHIIDELAAGDVQALVLLAAEPTKCVDKFIDSRQTFRKTFPFNMLPYNATSSDELWPPFSAYKKSKATPSKVAPSKAAPSKAAPSKATQSKAAPSKATQSKVTPKRSSNRIAKATEEDEEEDETEEEEEEPSKKLKSKSKGASKGPPPRQSTPPAPAESTSAFTPAMMKEMMKEFADLVEAKFDSKLNQVEAQLKKSNEETDKLRAELEKSKSDQEALLKKPSSSSANSTPSSSLSKSSANSTPSQRRAKRPSSQHDVAYQIKSPPSTKKRTSIRPIPLARDFDNMSDVEGERIEDDDEDNRIGVRVGVHAHIDDNDEDDDDDDPPPPPPKKKSHLTKDRESDDDDPPPPPPKKKSYLTKDRERKARRKAAERASTHAEFANVLRHERPVLATDLDGMFARMQHREKTAKQHRMFWELAHESEQEMKKAHFIETWREQLQRYR